LTLGLLSRRLVWREALTIVKPDGLRNSGAFTAVTQKQYHHQRARRADHRIGFPRGERQGPGKYRKHGSKEGRLCPFGFSREARMAPFVACESTLHCKLDSQLHWEAARSILWVGGKWIMEVPHNFVGGIHKFSLLTFACLANIRGPLAPLPACLSAHDRLSSMNFNIALPFYENALRSPERLALSVDRRDLSYGELAALSERIAASLEQGFASDAKRVGILASRSWVAYAGLLGACWAGAVYVPLSPNWPEQRLLRILEATELDALVVDDQGSTLLSPQVLKRSPKHLLAPGHSTSFSVGTSPTAAHIAGFDSLPPSTPLRPPKALDEGDLAYIMFTSGTTGLPKGVMISTGNVFSFLSAMRELYAFSAQDRVSQAYELTFDPSVLDMFTTWFSGASLHVVPAGQLMGPSRFIREKALTSWFSVPSTVGLMQKMKMLTAGAFPSLRYSIFCGEPLPASYAEAWQKAAPNSVVDNLYGPTEATVVCIGQRCGVPLVVTEGRGTVAIGKPFTGMDAAIVDSTHHFLPRGESGELALSGKQVAKGYFKDEQRTAERFRSINGRVWYLTGDLASQDTAGRFHHLGRTDNQVKVLGNRVELEEVEAHLREICGLESVAAVAWPVINGSALGIVAFVAGSTLSVAEIRKGMQSRVPKYMVPSQVRFIERLPLGANGKTDRKALNVMLTEGLPLLAT
jgi:D-alanine--poly(phosphoribitol) ligase subunit 1